MRLLGSRPHRAGELAHAAGVTPQAMSRHLRVLLRTGLVADERSPEDARLRVFRLRPEPVAELRAWLDELQAAWDQQLQGFKAHIEQRTAR